MNKYEHRTDLASEARDIWRESTEQTTRLSGVTARERSILGFRVETVRVLDEIGASSLNKPIGTYVTVNLDPLTRREPDAFSNGITVLSLAVQRLLPVGKKRTVLVCGLGNDQITSDSLGPMTVKQTMVTRHLAVRFPGEFGKLRKVSAVKTGVLGTTGIESAEYINALISQTKPDAIIAVDALASRRLSRVCNTVQLSDSGITPGSGVGNAGTELSFRTLGVPVLAIGVPTVVDASTLAVDLLEQLGGEAENITETEVFGELGGNMLVTPKDIDAQVALLAKFIGYGINLALHKGLTEADITAFLS
jgi:spore protease